MNENNKKEAVDRLLVLWNEYEALKAKNQEMQVEQNTQVAAVNKFVKKAYHLTIAFNYITFERVYTELCDTAANYTAEPVKNSAENL